MNKKIKLKTPVKIDGVLVHELSLRAPKVKDLMAVSRRNTSDMDREVNLIANLAEISVEAVQELELTDYLTIQNWLKDFLSPETSEN